MVGQLNSLLFSHFDIVWFGGGAMQNIAVTRLGMPGRGPSFSLLKSIPFNWSFRCGVILIPSVARLQPSVIMPDLFHCKGGAKL